MNNKNCKGTVGKSFVACGEEPDLYGYCSPECKAAAKIQTLPCKGAEVDYTFITDRLAVGNVASRAVPGFVAVVTCLASERPGILWAEFPTRHLVASGISWHFVDIADGESWAFGQDAHRLESYLDDATAFIAAHIARGCVLVHCGAGVSRSAAVVVAYLCRYAGMSYTEALEFVKQKRPCVEPADIFAAAIKRWLRLDELAATGPRR